MEFKFAAPEIRFGVGTAKGLDAVVTQLGLRAFVLTGADPARVATVTERLPVVATKAVLDEPTFDDAREAVAMARSAEADVVVGIGGGAVLDLAKAVAILALAEGDPTDYAEVIGAGLALPTTGLPWVAVPTTAGTGAEVTANAVLSSPQHEVKVSLRSTAMLARVALVDPELTLTCPPAVTAQSGMDAVTQCLEPLTSRLANPMVDALALAGLRRARTTLVRAFEAGDDIDARTDMSFCSLMGGLALANAKLGAVHGLAGVIGGVTGASHGAICGALLLPVTLTNIAAMGSRDPDNPALEGYRRAAEALTGEASLAALDDWLRHTGSALRLQGLGELGLSPDRWQQVVAASQEASSMKGNPIQLTSEELLGILRDAS